MTKYIGVVKPDLKINGMFYENTLVVSKPVIALVIVENSVNEEISIRPLCFFRDTGEIIPANYFNSYLGLEEEGREKDWSKEVDEFKARQKKPPFGRVEGEGLDPDIIQRENKEK